ncbi:type I secretion C-terminal target domain-containing protein [Vibrio lentus]|nr:type I secretion C-terminal target domain-containing protein [Vibrio lentus]
MVRPALGNGTDIIKDFELYTNGSGDLIDLNDLIEDPQDETQMAELLDMIEVSVDERYCFVYSNHRWSRRSNDRRRRDCHGNGCYWLILVVISRYWQSLSKRCSLVGIVEVFYDLT